MKKAAPAASMPVQSKSGRLWIRIKQQKWMLLMMLPAFLCLLMFCYIPLSGWYLAFSDYEIGGSLFSGKFVGLKYFIKIFRDSSDLSYLLRNTLVINCSSLILNIVLAMVFAVLLNEMRWKKGAKLVQTVSFFPYFVSWVIAYSVVWSMFAVKSGVINQFLVRIGALEKGLNILGDPKYSWGLIITLNVWKNIGYNTIIFLAAIAGISGEQYEAAALDGASRLQRIWFVTIPNLLPTLSVLLIMNSGWILNSGLEQFFIFSNSTNWSRMEVLDMYIYKFGLKMLDFPYSTAMSIIKTIVSIALLLTVNWITKKISKSAVI